jgi:hypothetical protein
MDVGLVGRNENKASLSRNYNALRDLAPNAKSHVLICDDNSCTNSFTNITTQWKVDDERKWLVHLKCTKCQSKWSICCKCDNYKVKMKTRRQLLHHYNIYHHETKPQRKRSSNTINNNSRKRRKDYNGIIHSEPITNEESINSNNTQDNNIIINADAIIPQITISNGITNPVRM